MYICTYRCPPCVGLSSGKLLYRFRRMYVLIETKRNKVAWSLTCLCVCVCVCVQGNRKHLHTPF